MALFDNFWHAIAGYSTLHKAVDFESFTSVRALINAVPENERKQFINALDSKGLRPLHYACMRSIENQQFIQGPPLGSSSTWYREPSPDMVALLLEFGADPNLPDSNGRTPLMTIGSNYISRYDPAPVYESNTQNKAKTVRIIRSLLAHHADPNIQTPEGDTAMHFLNEGLTKGYSSTRYYNQEDSQAKEVRVILVSAGAKDLANKQGVKPSDIHSPPKPIPPLKTPNDYDYVSYLKKSGKDLPHYKEYLESVKKENDENVQQATRSRLRT